METYVLIGVVLYLGAMMVWEKWQNKKERADLITRIMAKHLPDYSKHYVKITEENMDKSVEDIMAEVQDRIPVR